MCNRNNKTEEIPVKKYHLSDIYDLYWEDYIRSKDRNLWLEPKHFEAINKARVCGTDKLGIAVLSCTECGDTTYITRSCKHRFCARCGNADTNKWAKLTLSRLINDKHHHVVTTLPKQLRFLADKNYKLIYDLLFKVSAQILKSWFKSKHNLLPGIVSVLHTAGSDLKFHPHIHMLLSAGGKISTLINTQCSKTTIYVTNNSLEGNSKLNAVSNSLNSTKKTNSRFIPVLSTTISLYHGYSTLNKTNGSSLFKNHSMMFNKLSVTLVDIPKEHA